MCEKDLFRIYIERNWRNSLCLPKNFGDLVFDDSFLDELTLEEQFVVCCCWLSEQKSSLLLIKSDSRPRSVNELN